MIAPTRLAVILLGPSGAGKSSVISVVASQMNRFEINFAPLKKDTTRASRGDFESVEFNFLGSQEFFRRKQQGEYIIDYESYGEHYAVSKEILRIDEDLTPIIAIPTSLVTPFTAAIKSTFRVLVCALTLSPETVRTRLGIRGDEGTMRHFEARAQSATRPRDKVADVLLDADKPLETVAHSLLDCVIKARDKV